MAKLFNYTDLKLSFYNGKQYIVPPLMITEYNVVLKFYHNGTLLKDGNVVINGDTYRINSDGECTITKTRGYYTTIEEFLFEGRPYVISPAAVIVWDADKTISLTCAYVELQIQGFRLGDLSTKIYDGYQAGVDYGRFGHSKGDTGAMSPNTLGPYTVSMLIHCGDHDDSIHWGATILLRFGGEKPYGCEYMDVYFPWYNYTATLKWYDNSREIPGVSSRAYGYGIPNVYAIPWNNIQSALGLGPISCVLGGNMKITPHN